MQSLEQYFEALFDPNDLLRNWRKRAWDRFQELGLPRPKQEAFQYVPVQNLPFPKLALRPGSLPIGAAHGYRIVFVDGFFQEAHLPKPLVCLPLQAAMRTYGVFLQNRLTRSLKEEGDPFAALNGALQGDGAFFYAPPRVCVEEPIEIQQYFTTSGMASPHLQIFLGKGAQVHLIQRFSWLEDTPFCNSRIDASIDEGAFLFFGDKQQCPQKAILFQALRATLKRDARFHVFSQSSGAKLARLSIKAQLQEENSEVLLQGIANLEADLQMHNHVAVEHAAPRCRSRQHFKGVLRGKSRSSFEGKIKVAAVAQKTEAYQLSNHLLLSDAAAAHAKPGLEIFADDVKASHGATIAPLSPEDLFYLRSRGVLLQEAREMLIRGFCSEMMAAAPRSFWEE